MDRRQEGTGNSHWVKILFWLSLFVFLVYSVQTIIDLRGIAHPGRHEAFFRIVSAFFHPDFSNTRINLQVATEMWETILIAFLATTLSAAFAAPIAFLCSRPSSIWSRGLYILLQPIHAGIRAVHPLIVTLPAIILVGIGPTAGVLTLTLFSTAVFIEVYSDYAHQYSFLSWSALFQVHFPALAFKHFHVNFLVATVLGFMGGGGIGSFIQSYISLLDYRVASVALLACVLTIGSINLVSHAVWRIISDKNVSLSSAREITSLH